MQLVITNGPDVLYSARALDEFHSYSDEPFRGITCAQVNAAAGVAALMPKRGNGYVFLVDCNRARTLDEVLDAPILWWDDLDFWRGGGSADPHWMAVDRKYATDLGVSVRVVLGNQPSRVACYGLKEAKDLVDDAERASTRYVTPYKIRLIKAVRAGDITPEMLPAFMAVIGTAEPPEGVETHEERARRSAAGGW